ncbi:MAG: serine/threonine protein phosphatase [Mycobacterium sp.]|nr:serine/threonine protein phosphatase [Mycobacterium sp.]MDT5314129.1 family protein phosphatase [Mycobacterium sp.]
MSLLNEPENVHSPVIPVTESILSRPQLRVSGSEQAGVSSQTRLRLREGPTMRKRNEEVMVDMAPGPTPMAPQHRPRIWLEFDDGSAVGVRGAGLIGRDPAPSPGDRFEHLITLADDTLTVSRTHLEFGTYASGLWIRDRSSTNGSVIETNGHRTAVATEMSVSAPAGSTIHFGAHRVAVRNIPACELMNVAAIEWVVTALATSPAAK